MTHLGDRCILIPFLCYLSKKFGLLSFIPLETLGMAQGHYHNITKADICEMNNLELNYQSNSLDTYVSCIEQEMM